jgi:glucose dehydrogenase (acceptor)
MKISLEVAKTPPMKKLGAKPFPEAFPGCEDIKPIYSDEYLRCVAKVYSTTIWHPSGTCKMGKKGDETAVVDPQCRVQSGVSGLRVVDISIMPTLISGNTNAPAAMIAEKVADLIKGRQLENLLPPISQEMINKLPNLPYKM